MIVCKNHIQHLIPREDPCPWCLFYAAEKDARRYRWIRDKAVPESLPDLIMALPEGTDEVIDECIAESEEK